MSRVGKVPVKIPSGVTVTIDHDTVTVNGSKGSLTQFTMPGVNIKQQDDELVLEAANDERESRSKHGLMRSLVQNMVTGVSQGFEKKLEVNGIGYRINLAGQDLRLNLGLSHEVVYKVPEGIEIKVEQNIITVSGINRQQVGQVAAEIRALKKPEPYKGKGIKYADERIIRKSGKSGKEK
ncbi:MAG TPA: 50S ribosomal protein L6 [Candidatus Saccharimonadales bacterium]|nr:50S ribosomal protein L6 [Candidatus Saccharimonadales bacterium]